MNARMPPARMLIVSPLKALAAVTFRVSPLPMLMVAPAPKVLATVAVSVPPLTLTVPEKGLERGQGEVIGSLLDERARGAGSERASEGEVVPEHITDGEGAAAEGDAASRRAAAQELRQGLAEAVQIQVGRRRCVRKS